MNKCEICNTHCALYCYEPTLELGSQLQSTASIFHIRNRPAGARSAASSERWRSEHNKITLLKWETLNEQARRSESRTGRWTHPAVFGWEAFWTIVTQQPSLQVEFHDVSAGGAAEKQLIVFWYLCRNKSSRHSVNTSPIAAQPWELIPPHAAPPHISPPSWACPSDTLWAWSSSPGGPAPTLAALNYKQNRLRHESTENPAHSLPSPPGCDKEVAVGVAELHSEAGAATPAWGWTPTNGLLAFDVPDDDSAAKSTSSVCSWAHFHIPFKD